MNLVQVSLLKINEQIFIKFYSINERMCYLWIRGKFINISLINIHAPTEDKNDDIKDEFFEKLENVYDSLPRYDMKIILDDCNAKIDKKDM